MVYRSAPLSAILDLWVAVGPFNHFKPGNRQGRWSGRQVGIRRLVKLKRPLTFNALKLDPTTCDFARRAGLLTGQTRDHRRLAFDLPADHPTEPLERLAAIPIRVASQAEDPLDARWFGWPADRSLGCQRSRYLTLSVRLKFTGRCIWVSTGSPALTPG